MKEFGARRSMGEQGEIFKICMISTMHIDKIGHRVIIKWLPLVYPKKSVQQIIKSLSKPCTEPYIRAVDEGNAYTFSFTPDGSIELAPHYARIQRDGKEHIASIQIEGKRMKCCQYGTDRHLPKMCEKISVRVLDGVKIKDVFF